FLLVQRADATAHLEGAVPAHPLERRQALGRRRLGQPRDRVGEHPPVVLVNAEPGGRPVLRLEVLADAQRAVGVDPPRELDPELVLLPDLAWVGLTGVFDSLSQPLASGA